MNEMNSSASVATINHQRSRRKEVMSGLRSHTNIAEAPATSSRTNQMIRVLLGSPRMTRIQNR